MQVLRPQPGPQTAFLASSADIVLYGGAAGGGKSFALLLECTRHLHNPAFSAVIFRRTTPQIRNPGALWDQSWKVFSLPCFMATPVETKLEWNFPSGAMVKFAHMEYEKNAMDWQGSEIPMLGWDELTHFTKSQFTYMLSRNRSMCGVTPYIRATTNPDSESWVADFIAWWIDQETGYAIPERSGVVRWFVVYEEEFQWGDSAQELHDQWDSILGAENVFPLSFTFILANLDDNKLLQAADPTYRAKLMAMSNLDRERLLKGNWKISSGDGLIKSEWIRFYSQLPAQVEFYTWSWDTAIKEKQENDYSAGQLWAVCADGYYLVRRHKVKLAYPKLKKLVWSSFQDFPTREVLIEDKSSGQQLIQDFESVPEELKKEYAEMGRKLIPMPVIKMNPNGISMARTKTERVNFVSTLFEAGKVFLPDPSLPGNEWVKETMTEWVKFPNVTHDDEVDSMSQFLSRRLKNPEDFLNGIGTFISTEGGNLDSYVDQSWMPGL